LITHIRRPSGVALAIAAFVAVAGLPACASSDGGGAATTTATTAAGTSDGTSSTIAPSASSTSTAPTTTDAPSTTTPPTTASTALPLPAPEGDAFYTPPDPLPAGQPGDVIWARTITAPPGAKAWTVLYLSKNAKGAPIAVSGTVVAPDTPGTDRPILAWGHGTTGMDDRCATSKQFALNREDERLLVDGALKNGYVFTATDYEGLGTPGVHAYLVGLSEGQGVLDSIRAAQRLEGTGAGPNSKSVVWGHSQGGGSAAMAADLAPTYAPDAHVLGSAAGAPAAEPGLLLDGALSNSATMGLGFMIAEGFHVSYPDLPLDGALTPDGIAMLDRVATTCNDTLASTIDGAARDSLVKGLFTQQPGWPAVLEENAPGTHKTDVPVFLYHGEADALVPPVISQLLYNRYCKLGVPVERKTYPGGTHTSVIALALTDIQNFLNDRIAGKPFHSTC
jgi:pimeloyl-ACP methyl ester carboxylesterase